MISKQCSNLFWNDVFAACKTLYDNIWLPKNTNYKEIPIWYNTICSHLNKEWFVNGIVDALFINENFVTLDYLHNVRGVM